MGLLDFIFKRGGKVAEAAAESRAGAEAVWEEAHAMNNIRKGFPQAPQVRTTKSGGVHAKDVPKVEAYNKQVDDIIQPAHEEAKAMNQAMDKPKLEDLFTNHAGTPGIGQGMMIGGAFAAGGSMLYGGAHMMSPNNSEVNNPIKNMVKGAFVGGIAGAAMLASHNFATGKNFVKASKASDANWFMKKAGEHAAGVSSALNTNVTKGALAAGLIAGSGQFDLTRPVNPVY